MVEGVEGVDSHCGNRMAERGRSAYGCRQDKRADAERSTDLPDEWSGTGSRDMDGAQLGCWRERGSVSDQLLAGGRATHAGNRDAMISTLCKVC
jgi:hypothetical protein